MIELIVIALTFALCFGIDKLYNKLFRSRAQHKTGKAVRLSRRYATYGVVFSVVGVLATMVGIQESLILSLAGVAVIAFGVGLVVYYISFGVYYDGESFLLSTFGQKSQVYRYDQITAQQRYVVQGGSYVVELHLKDGRTVQLHSTMEGYATFLNYAWEKWLVQTRRRAEDCDFHDPDNYCWFPAVEV